MILALSYYSTLYDWLSPGRSPLPNGPRLRQCCQGLAVVTVKVVGCGLWFVVVVTL